MPAVRRNPPPAAFRAVDSLPGSPAVGESVLWGGFPLVYSGSLWRPSSGAGRVVDAGDGVGARAAVRIVGGEAVLTNAIDSGSVHGVSAYVEGGSCLVLATGPLGGFAGLTEGEALFVGPEDGEIRHGPLDPAGAILRLGFATSETEMMVMIEEWTG